MPPRSSSRSVRQSIRLALLMLLAHSGSALAQSAAVSPSKELTSHLLSPRIGTATTLGCAAGSDAMRPSCITAAVDAIAPDVLAQSVPAVLTLRDAIQRALEHNLTILGLRHAVSEQRGVQRVARSQLLPSLTGEFSGLEQRLDLAARGVDIDIPLPGFEFESVVGPFGVLDWRARLSQAIFNLQAMRNHRATREAVRASELTLEDARDLITVSVGRAYLEGQAARARVDATRAQVETATAIHERAVQQKDAGLATPLDVKRAEVQTLTARHRLVTLEAALARQKIDLSRLAGLPGTDQYDLEPGVPFSPAPPLSLEEALKEAAERRADLQAADARVLAAELALSATRAERLPSVALNADYGASLATGHTAVNTYTVSGVIRVPLWEGGRIGGQVEQAMSALSRRRAERDDLRAQIEADVRKAYVDLQAAQLGVEVSARSVQVTRETLDLTRERFDAGVSDNVAVVQSQESFAAAERDYIDSVLAHNFAKLDLARSLGRAAEEIDHFLQFTQVSR